MSRYGILYGCEPDPDGPGGIGPKPDGDGWYKCGCHCHTAAKQGIKVYHVVACCNWGWKQWFRLHREQDDGNLD
jgi:hypothetical protein